MWPLARLGGMASKALRRLPRDWLPERGFDALEAFLGSQATCGDLIEALPDAMCIADVAGVSWPVAADLLDRVAALVTPLPQPVSARVPTGRQEKCAHGLTARGPVRTEFGACRSRCRAQASSLLASRTRGAAGAAACLPTGLRDLDHALGGGLGAGSIVEAVGETGVGKSQLAMSMAARAPLPAVRGGLGGGVLFVDTEGKFSPSRLCEIATNLDAVVGDPVQAEARVAAVLEAVTVMRATNSRELRAIMEDLEAIVARSKVRLVVVDSVAALARRDFDQSSLRERQGELSRIASLLKSVAEAYGLVVLVTNQVAGRLSPEEAGPMPGGTVRPALGNTWSHCVNTRLVLQHLPASVVALPPAGAAAGPFAAALHAAAEGGVRTVSVAKSPVAPNATDVYVIGAAGITPLPAGTRFEGGGGATEAAGAALGSAWASVSASAAADSLAGTGIRDRIAEVAAPSESPAGSRAAAEDADVFDGLTEAELAALEA